jgi:uncharacterized membrane protein (DUF485 family)
VAWREKLAWINLVAMLIAYSVYFTLISTSVLSPISMLRLFTAVTVVEVVAVIVVTIVLAALSHHEARAKADERDRAIGRRGASVAYFMLIIGVLTVGVVLPFSNVGWPITNAALLALVIAEVVRHIIIVVSYRRGWHG